MIVVKIRKYVDVADVQHIATTWVVASDREMTNVLELKERSTTMLELFFSPLEVPKGFKYYVRATRHFNQENMDYDMEPIEVVNVDKKYTNMIFQGDNYIEEPFLSVSKFEIMDNDDALLTIKTSKFKSNYDKHKATHWLVLDEEDNVIYANMNDTKNLTSIEIENSYQFRNKNKVTFVAIHVGHSGMESAPGREVVYFNKEVNWYIDRSILSIDPGMDFTFKFLTLSDNMDIRSVIITYPVSNDIIYSNTDSPITEVTIPLHVLKENTQYNMFVTSICDGNRVTTSLRLSTSSYNNMIIRDENYIYKNIFKYRFQQRIYMPPNVNLSAMYNGNILVPTIIKNLNIYRWNNGLIKTTATAVGIRLPSEYIDNMLVKPISRALVLIDCYNENRHPTFLLYRYNLKSNDFTLLNTLTRDDELHPIGINGSYIFPEYNRMVYIPYGKNMIREYHIDNNVVTTLKLNPLEDMTKGLIIQGRLNRAFVCNGSDHNAVMFNLFNKNVTTGYQFYPPSFINKDIRAIPLINGNTLVYSADPTMHNIDGNVMFYDYNKARFIMTSDRFPKDKMPNSSIFLDNGEVVLYYVGNGTNEQGGVFHTLDQYLYT